MQIFESEIVIPLKYKPRLTSFFPLAGALLFLAFLFTLWIIEGFSLAGNASRFPDIQQNFQREMVIGVIVFAVVLLLYGLLIIIINHQKRTSSPYVRINHEGIFTSLDSFLIKWVEIKELSSATFMGFPYLRIVPWDLASVASRAQASSKGFHRFGINLTFLLFSRAKSSMPLGIFQMALSIPVDELLVAIQERFGAELREHHILVRGLQY